jgi:LysR family transcriptional regulator (chromosome initiation inhibitor)
MVSTAFPHDQLKALLAAVEYGTLDAAAQRLHLSPSAVSQRIKALEESVGRILLQRTKPVRPTASGEVLLRLARRTALFEADTVAELAELNALGGEQPAVTVVINADSLATWALPVLAESTGGIPLSLDIRREDQDHSLGLLRDGIAMLAITSNATAIGGCEVRRLGAMRYRPLASPEFVARWFPGGATIDELAAAPVVNFDHRDDLQNRYLRHRSVRLSPPSCFIPSSDDFVRSITLGMGWGLVPDLQGSALLSTGSLVRIDSGYDGDQLQSSELGYWDDVELYLQHWRLHSAALSVLIDRLTVRARRTLLQTA